MATTLYRGLHNFPSQPRGVVATIGTFDGVHRGHQKIMSQVREQAARYSLPSAAIIFESHPREVLLGDRAPARLMRLREKIDAIGEQGIQQIFCLKFNRKLQSMDAGEFVEHVLVEKIGVRSLIVGDDFRFGLNRMGNATLLEEAGGRYGFEVMDTLTVEHQGRRISSTWIREALAAGDLSLARDLLGRNFSISGRVIEGEKVGRTLGVPTANVNLKRQRAPLSGVYVVQVDVESAGEKHPAVANVGVRPTVNELDKPILEVHLLDWNQDIYRRHINVEFLKKIRDERHFADLDALKEWIHRDIEEAKTYFAHRASGANDTER